MIEINVFYLERCKIKKMFHFHQANQVEILPCSGNLMTHRRCGSSRNLESHWLIEKERSLSSMNIIRMTSLCTPATTDLRCNMNILWYERSILYRFHCIFIIDINELLAYSSYYINIIHFIIIILYLYFSLIVFRSDILERLVQLQNFRNQFLPNALRKFFKEISAPNDRGSILNTLIENFSQRFCACNPSLGLSRGNYSTLCWFFLSLFPTNKCQSYFSKAKQKTTLLKILRIWII